MTKKMEKIQNKLLILTIYMTIISVNYQVTSENCTCGLSDLNRDIPGGRVFGGEDADFNEFPWQAAFVLSLVGSYVGQGSIISNLHVLTCAHNFLDADQETQVITVDFLNDPISAIIGSRFIAEDFTRMSPDEQLAYQIRSIDNIVLHPQYSPLPYTAIYDIAVLRFQTPIPIFYVGLGPICLAFDDTFTYENELAFFAGYGETFVATPISNILQKASFLVQPNDICPNFNPEFQEQFHLCTFKDTQSTCGGDSGGALIYYNQSELSFQQIGIVIIGPDCTPEEILINVNVFIRVTYFHNWILSVAGESQFCSYSSR